MSPADEINPLVEALPPAVRAAVLAQDNAALVAALRQMPRAEAEALARWLLKAGILEERGKASPDIVEDAPLPSVAAPSAAPPPASPWPATVARALASGNRDAVFEALADLPPEIADALYVQLQEQGLL
jgi:hypothetical protein